MAQPGSFGAGQLKTNNKKEKDILNTMADATQAMKENQTFLQGQQELYLRAQQFAQGEEQKVRQMNFETETDSRQRLKDSIKQNYNIQLQNDEAESNSRLALYNEIGAFSKTAMKVGGDMINDRINKRRQANSALVARTGLDASQIQDIQALDNNLTKSAFMQTQAILDLKASGTSDEDINAIYQKVYKDSGSLAWVDNKAVLRNSVDAYRFKIAEWDAENPQATAKERLTAYNQMQDTFVTGLGDGSGRQWSAEVLESTIGGEIRTITNDALMRATSLQGQENLAAIKLKSLQTFDNIYRGGGGANGLMMSLKDKPESRSSLVKYLSNGLTTNKLGPDAVEDILNTKLIGYGGGDKSFIEAFGATDEVAALVSKINSKYSNIRSQARNRQANAYEDTNNEILRRGNDALEDGMLSNEEYANIRAYAEQTGLDVSKLTALARIKRDTTGARERLALEGYIKQQRQDGNWNLQTMAALDLPNDLFTKYESSAIAGSKIKSDPKVKSYKTSFKLMLANNPAIDARGMEKSASVEFMANKYTDDFRKEVQSEMASMANQGLAPDFDTAAETASKTIERKIQEYISKPSSIDTDSGEYVDFINSFKDVSDDEIKRLKLQSSINKALLNGKQNEVYKAVDKEAFIEYQAEYQGQVNPVAELIAATMNNGLTAEQVHNKLAKEFKVPPLSSTSRTREEINASVPPILRRYQVFDRVPERVAALEYGAVNAPRRGKFAQATGEGIADQDDTDALVETATSLGVNPLDLATIIGFETGGSYSPDQVGGEGGNYRGLIQFGPAEQRKYGIVPGMSFRNQLISVAAFLKDRFSGVGMDTNGASLEDLYTTVLAGNPKANRNSQDSFGTSASSGVGRMGPHREAASKRYGLK